MAPPRARWGQASVAHDADDPRRRFSTLFLQDRTTATMPAPRSYVSLAHFSSFVDYSERRAVSGSMRAARRAGTRPARVAAAKSKMDVVMIISGFAACAPCT